MDFPSTSEIEIKSFTDLSIFDGLGSNFKKHLDANFAKGGSDDKTDSLFIESVVINNDINLEDELIKAKDEDESAFKILSISFYDKKTPTISNKTQNNSPLRSEENNKVFTLRPSPKNRNLIPKTGSQPSLTPFVGEIAVNALKDNRLGSPKLSIKTDVKLFSIKEKVNKLNISPQITPQKPHFAPGVLGSPIEKSRSHAVLKDLPKPEREAKKPQRPNSPRKESISREASAEKKLNTLDLKISAMIKSKSPGNTIKKSSSKERIFASPQRVTFSVSPKGFKFHPKIEVAVEKVKISRESSEKKISMSNARNEKEESPMRNQSPAATFSLNKTILARRFDLQRVSLNNVNYSSTKDLHAKESRTPSKAMQRQEAGSQQTPTPKQVKVDLARGYRSNQSFYSKVASRRGSNNEQQKNSKILGQKLRINTEENSATKISVKDLCDMSVQVQGSRSVKGKMRGIDFSTMKQRDNTFSAGKDMFDIQKPSLKSQQSKAKLKETLTKDVDLAKKKNPVLPLQCRTFDI